MDNETKIDIKEKLAAPDETGTTSLLIGGGIGAYGTTLAVTGGIICPTCVVAAPLFLGWGGVQRYRHLQRKKTDAEANGTDISKD